MSKEQVHVLLVEQLAERWGVSTQSIRKMLRNGTLRGFKVGTAGKQSQWRVTLAEVERYERGEVGE